MSGVGEEATADAEFRVRVSLERFFSDERSRVYMSCRRSQPVRSLARRLRRQFALPRRLALLSRGHLLPPDEPLAVLQLDDPVEVISSSTYSQRITHMKDKSSSIADVLNCDEVDTVNITAAHIYDHEAGDAAPSPDRAGAVTVSPATDPADLSTCGFTRSVEIPNPAIDADPLVDSKRCALQLLEAYEASVLDPGSVRAGRRRRRVRRRRVPRPVAKPEPELGPELELEPERELELEPEHANSAVDAHAFSSRGADPSPAPAVSPPGASEPSPPSPRAPPPPLPPPTHAAVVRLQPAAPRSARSVRALPASAPAPALAPALTLSLSHTA